MKKIPENPFGYDTTEDNTGFLLWQVSSMWQQIQEKALRANFGLSQSQYVVLASTYWLNVLDREITQINLAQHTKIDKMTVSKILKILEDKSLIYRKPHSTDSRANAVYLTQEGKDLMSKAIDIIETIDKEFFLSFGKKIDKLNHILLKLIETNKNLFFQSF
ncbi:MAG: MarR family winged helix-turn-helix transcriptional regulator [Prevotella sp.]|jgi:DNA-binding MarR family transcriptional regulator|nr:MarR family winged helix-turn-helix transcriptional regulator [Prevotella sp.]